MDTIQGHEQELLQYALSKFKELHGVAIIGPQTEEERSGVISFVVNNIHAHDIAQILDQEGIAVRAGHHCAQPLAHRYGIPATARASFAVYSTKEDVDHLIAAIKKAQELFA
jgi:cysteine desulfurase/selenocysteine lyase